MDERYPQHEKMKALEGKNHLIGDFIEWLGEHGYHLCERTTNHPEGHAYWPTHKGTQQILAEHFGIDIDELNREKDRMYDEMQRAMQSQSAKPIHGPAEATN